MKYIIINNTSNPLEYVKTLSRELWKISRPVKNDKDVSQYLFGWIKHKDQERYALKVDLEYEINIHPSKDVSSIIQMLNDDVSIYELNALASQLDEVDKIKFKNILPMTYKTHTFDEMVELGWVSKINEI